jgi:hypothetical protein
MIGKQGVIFAARGVPHAFMITSDTAHLLVLQTPGSGEDFYRAASEPLTSADDASRPADLPKLQRAAQESESIVLHGPPPFDVAPPLASGAASTG